MTKREKHIVRAAIVVSAMLAVMPVSHAMHIMEGYLPVSYCVAWGAVCIPFLVVGMISLKKKLNIDRREITLIAMAGAFIFVVSLLLPLTQGYCTMADNILL